MHVEVIVKLAVTMDMAAMGRALESCVRATGVSLRAVHPTTADRELASYFVASAPPDRLDDMLARLARCPGVEAAYAKPAGPAPALQRPRGRPPGDACEDGYTLG